MLNPTRLAGVADGLRAIAQLDDPVGQEMAAWTRPNGLAIARVRVPLGVIGIIYESRPNDTADAGGQCLKAGNAASLRGGSESFHSSRAIIGCLHRGWCRRPAAGRGAIGADARPGRRRRMLAMAEAIDVIVPRGGKSLIEHVQNESRVPVFAHLEGLCHVYVDAAADLDMAREITLNAKMRRTSVCGAAETLLVDRAIAPDFLPDAAALRRPAAPCAATRRALGPT